MQRTVFFSLGLLLAALASVPALAQQRGLGARAPAIGMHTGPAARLHGLNPSMSLSGPSTSPLQSQMQNDYAAQLRGEQRDLLQQNPSGTTRQELSIGHALNGFTPQ